MKKQIDELHELSESIYMSGYALDWEDRNDIAEHLYNADYRKQSDTAREIFAEIEEIFNRRIAFYTDMKSQAVLFFEEKYAETMITNCTIYLQDIAELKKKFTEGE